MWQRTTSGPYGNINRMKRQRVAFGLVGILVGFVLGFFLSRYLESTKAPPAGPAGQAAASGGGQQLPEGHPPIDAMQQIQELEAHAREHPEHVEVKIQLANAYFDLHRFDEAIRWYEAAQELQPDNIQVNNDLGTAYYASGKVDEGIRILERSLQLQQDEPVALMNLGWIYFATNRFQQAISYWERLVEAHPEFDTIDEVKKQLENARAHVRGEHS